MVDLPPRRLVPRRLVPPRPPLRRGPPLSAQEASGKRTTMLQPALTLGAVFLTGAHLIFGRDGFDFLSRLLFSIPGLLIIGEFYRYYRNEERREMPFTLFALLQFYVAFSFPSFFEMDFFDLNGPVIFTESTRFYGSVAVAGGGLALYGGMRLGEIVGFHARPRLISACPPNALPSGFQNAVWVYVGVCVVFAMAVISIPSAIPGSLRVILDITIAFDLAIGLGLAQPELLRGWWSQRLSMLAFIVGAVLGLLRGMLDPVIRLGLVFMARRWSETRKLSFSMIGALGAVYLLFQPVKQDFRSRVWTSQEQVGYADRVNGWATAFDKFWSRDDNQEKTVNSAVDRIAELDPVMHAIQVIPVSVQYLEGQGWTYILTAPIPRFLWPDKPTTQGTAQRYAIVFNRQTEEGSRGTAILLPLLVDGYWNFGWMGIGFACLLMGLWTGLCQRLWAGDHWALRAMGVSHLSRLVVSGGVGSHYSGLFQHMTGLLVACWAVYAIAKLTSNKEALRTAPRRFATR